MEVSESVGVSDECVFIQDNYLEVICDIKPQRDNKPIMNGKLTTIFMFKTKTCMCSLRRMNKKREAGGLAHETNEPENLPVFLNRNQTKVFKVAVSSQ